MANCNQSFSISALISLGANLTAAWVAKSSDHTWSSTGLCQLIGLLEVYSAKIQSKQIQPTPEIHSKLWKFSVFEVMC
jgi:hypothetical protein